MVNYEKLDFLYPEKNRKTIYIFELFLEKLFAQETPSMLKNKELNPLRLVREFFTDGDFTMVDHIDTTHRVSGNYYQHRHDLFLVWRDMQKNYSDFSRLMCMLACGELNTQENTCLIEISQNVYVASTVSVKLQEQIDKVKHWFHISEIWGALMGFEYTSVSNISLGCEQYRLPHMESSPNKADVVVYHNGLELAKLDVSRATRILESWCDGESSLDNMALLTTQPLFSKAMREDGLIGSFVAKPNLGKSLYTDILTTIYRHVSTFSHKYLTDSGYQYADLMASIVTNAKDFAVFQETDGISTNAMTALKPLVTYTDRVSARFFGSKSGSFEASYHGSVVLTSNKVNTAPMTSDFTKRLVNIKLRYSDLVSANVRWMQSEVGAVSLLVACLAHRSKLIGDTYRPAVELKKMVRHFITDSVVADNNVLLVKEFLDEQGCLYGKDIAAIFNNPRGEGLDSILREYGLTKTRTKRGIAYTLDPNNDNFNELLSANYGGVPVFDTKLYDLYQQDVIDYRFNVRDEACVVLDLDANDYQAWCKDPQEFKRRSKVKYMVSASNDTVLKTEATSFNRIILDYDKFPSDTTFEQVRMRLDQRLGNVWFSLWETPRSVFGALRLRVMVMLSSDIPVDRWSSVAAQLDEMVGVASDPMSAPVHKQGLALPWLKWFTNVSNAAWEPKFSEATIETVARNIDAIPTDAPEEFQAFLADFNDHVDDHWDSLSDYYFWMRTYLLPIARYISFDKSITFEQGCELIRLTSDDELEQEKNVELLANAVKRGAGELMFERYDVSIAEFYGSYDTSSEGFSF